MVVGSMSDQAPSAGRSPLGGAPRADRVDSRIPPTGGRDPGGSLQPQRGDPIVAWSQPPIASGGIPVIEFC